MLITVEEFLQCNWELASFPLLTFNDSIINEESRNEEDNCTHLATIILESIIFLKYAIFVLLLKIRQQDFKGLET